MALNFPRLSSNTLMPYQALELQENGQLVLKRVIERKPSMGTKEGSRVEVHPRTVAPPPVITTLKASEFIREQLVRDTRRPERAPAPGIRLDRCCVLGFAAESSQKNSMQKPCPAAVLFKANEAQKNCMQNLNEAAEKRRNDGRIHSYPHRKNGPYTCPKCKGVYATSQLFAAHVSSIHYKSESKSERRKRLTARYCKRNPRVEMVDGKPTIIWGNKKNSITAPPPSFSPAPHPPVRVVVKSECVQELPPPPPGFERLIPPPLGFQKQIPPPPGFPVLAFPVGFRNPIPPLGFRTPIPPPPGFENCVPGFPLPSGFRRSIAAPRGVQIKQEIQ